MAKNYQQLQQYRGSLYGDLNYSGLEYDYEVPDNIVISSPGGVSDIHHHYTKGMYGNGAVTDAIYAGEGYRYPAGEDENLYQYGQQSVQQQRMYPPGPDPTYTQNFGTYKKDNFAPGMEIIPPPEDKTAIDPISGGRNPQMVDLPEITQAVKTAEAGKHKLTFPHPIILMLVFFCAYVAFTFWINSAQGFIAQRFHQGRPIPWQWTCAYAFIFSGLTYLLISYFDVPLFMFEKL
jgi:hypothetical protein